MADKILDRLSKILKQAENASTEAEAHAFMQKAQEIATVNAIDLAIARQHTAKQEQREQPEARWIKTGPRGTKLLAKRVSLAIDIARNNDVKCNIAHDSTGIQCFGFPSDIDVVEALFASLLVQMIQAGDEYVSSKAYVGETYWGYTRDSWGYETYGEKKVDGRVARASFYDGFTTRIRERLREARKAAVASYDADHGIDLDTQVKPSGFDSAPGAALALVAKEVEVRDFYKEKSNARGSWKGSSTQGHSNGARSAGHAAGGRARLSSQKALS